MLDIIAPPGDRGHRWRTVLNERAFTLLYITANSTNLAVEFYPPRSTILIRNILFENTIGLNEVDPLILNSW